MKTAVAAAMKKLREDREAEARFMHGPDGSSAPAYNVQIAVDGEHAIVVAQAVTTEANDKRSLLPMAKAAVGDPAELHVVADAGYSHGAQAEACERQGIVPHVPVQRSVNNQSDGSLLDRGQFTYDAERDQFRCPAGQTLERKSVKKDRSRILYQARAEACGACWLKARCTQVPAAYGVSPSARRGAGADGATGHCRGYAFATQLRRAPLRHSEVLDLRAPTFSAAWPRWCPSEISLAVLSYNLKRMLHVLGAALPIRKLTSA